MSRQEGRASGVATRSNGWAGSALVLTVIVAILAKIGGVIVAPGAHGIAGEGVVEVVETMSGALAYTLAGLLIALVCAASFELARARSVQVVVRGGVVAIAGLIVALASPAVVERLSTIPLLALSVVTSLVALVAGLYVARVARTRAVGAVLTLLAVSALLRIVAWETAAMAFEHPSMRTLEVARGFATVAVLLHALATLLAAIWLGTRSRWRGRLLANAALLAAFVLTWFAGRGAMAPSGAAAVLHASLSEAVSFPTPFVAGPVAAFLVPASILLAAVAAAQPGRRSAVTGPLALALLSHGSFDVPLQALLVTAAAQWAMLAMAAERSVPSSSVAPPAPPEPVREAREA